MRIRTMGYFIKEALVSIHRNKLMSFASIGILTICLTILGAFTLVVLNLEHQVDQLEAKGEIRADLIEDISMGDIIRIQEKIRSMDDVKQVIFVSKDAALKSLQKEWEDKEILETLATDADNPLPNSFRIKLKDVKKIGKIDNIVKKIPGIAKTRFGHEYMERLVLITRVLRIVGIVSIALLSLGAIFIIVNTIRLTVFARRKEIEIMKFVGATDWFIKWPFLMEGMALGLISALIGYVLIHYGYYVTINLIREHIHFITLIYNKQLIIMLVSELLVVGVLIGAIASIISLKRFLRV